MSFLWHGLTEQGAQVPVQVDAQGRVVAVDGTPGVSNWERTGTTLSPAVAGDSVDIGSGNITLSASGSATFAGQSTFSGALSVYRDGADKAGFSVYNGTVGAPGNKREYYTNSSGVLAVGGIGGAGIDPTDISNTSRIVLDGTDGSAFFAGDVSAVDFSTKLPGAASKSVDILSSADGGVIYIRNGSGTITGEWNREVLRLGGTNLGLPTAAPNIALNANGNGTFEGTVGAGAFKGETTNGTFFITQEAWLGFGGNVSGGSPNAQINADGSATFAGNITAPNVTFRSADPQFYAKKSKNKDALPEYVGPELDLLAEIARLEALVRHLYETLRLTPPAGWPVWDGNDDVLRQLRK